MSALIGRPALAAAVCIAVLAVAGCLLQAVASGPAQAGTDTVVVDTTTDHGDVGGTCFDGDCTLREAIHTINGSLIYRIIEFDIDATSDPGCSPITGVCTLEPLFRLPLISRNNAVIDGFSQGPPPAETSLGIPPPTSPPDFVQRIVIDGSELGIGPGSVPSGFTFDNTGGIEISGNTVTVQGLVITNFGLGIRLDTGGGHTVRGNRLGTNAAGTAEASNRVGLFMEDSANNTIGGTESWQRNLISGNEDHGIEAIGSSSGNSIVGNYIGTNASGTAAIPNGSRGIFILDGADTVIGGTTAAQRNVISGNTSAGVFVQGVSATNVLIQGNYIGTNAAGTAAIPNATGVVLDNFSSQALVGGTSTGARNVISGNTFSGISIDDDSVNHQIKGNYIGTNAAGTSAIPNSDGIRVIDPSSGNLIGGTENGAGNLIAFNAGAGVQIDKDAFGNSILANSIHSNGELGIDLEPYTVVNLNDPGDGDVSPAVANNGQNYPVLESAVQGSVQISGVFDSQAGDYRFEFFANEACDGSGFGEGQTFLGGATATLPQSGEFELQATINVNLPAGALVSATATNQGTGDTSEFSNCVEVEAGATPTPSPTASATPTQTTAVTATPTPTLTGTASPTPTPTANGSSTPTESATPTPTEDGGGDVDWGDNNCSGDADPVDALLALRFDAGLDANTGECPEMGAEVEVDGASLHLWGDVDCSGAVDPVDGLKVLRHDAGLSVTQEPGCPEIGANVVVAQVAAVLGPWWRRFL